MSDNKKVRGYISVSSEDKALWYSSNEFKELTRKVNLGLTEAFKGEVNINEEKFPRGIGEKHPFNFELTEKTCANFGIMDAAINKIADSIIGEFAIETKDENDKELIISFIKESGFKTEIKPWIVEALKKGNGYMDLSEINNSRLQALNANDMYIKRNKKGKIISFNQFIGKKGVIIKENINTFEPKEIAHLSINPIPGRAYGQGIMWSSMVAINNFVGGETDRHKLLTRKAGAPIHAKVGVPGEQVQSSDIDSFKTDLQYMNNRTEWVTDANVDMKVLDFGDVGKNLSESAKFDLEQLSIGLQIPMVLLGVANIPEGLAKVQIEGYQRFIQSLRVIIEEVIERKILKPFLLSQGRSTRKIDFIWELPGEEEKNNRLTTIQTAMSSPLLSPELRAALEKEYASVLGLEEVVDMLIKPEEARKRADEEARKKEEEIKQPEVPGVKPTAKQEELLSHSHKVDDNEKTSGEVSVTPALASFSGVAPLNERIEKRNNEYCVISHKTGKSLGCYPTRAQAVARLAQIKKFSDNEKKLLSEEEIISLPLSEYVNITEIKGFNYSDYLIKILQKLKNYGFNDLKAVTEQDLIEGLLPQKDISKLRLILKNGFQKNLSIREIKQDIENSLDLKDRIKFDDGKEIITAKASDRPMMIARTETVRLANEGLKDLYIENNIKKYEYLAAIDDRTSDICLSLDGQVFDMNDAQPGVNMPPMHVNCRSTIIGVV